MMQYWFLLITINLVSCASSRDESILRYFDLTNDGVVDKRELRRIAYSDYKIAPEFSDSIFRRVDKNGDNELNETEIEAGKTLIEANAKQMTEQWLKEHDVDNNGKLSQFELMQGEYMEHGHSFGVIRKHFEESDINGDLFLDSEELMHVRRLLRSLALKDASELMKRYDSDNDHFLSLREAQILADEVFDLGPEITSSILETVDFRKQQKINELELVDFLSELRAEAATEALDKLTILDENGNGMISFDELLDRYGEDLKKSVLKKIFFRVDLNKNANIDPIEYISMQKLILSQKHKDAVLPNQPDKPHRVITVQRAPSPELEALLLAGKQQNEKADYHHRSQPKRTRLARQAGIESTNGTKQNDDEPKSDSDEYKDFSVVPFQEPNSDTSPLQGANNDTSLLEGANNDTSLLQAPNNDTIVRRKAKKNPAQKKSRNFIDELRKDLYKILGGVNKKNAKLIGVVNDSLKLLGSDYRIGDDVNMNDNSTASTDQASSIDKDELKNDEGINGTEVNTVNETNSEANTTVTNFKTETNKTENSKDLKLSTQKSAKPSQSAVHGNEKDENTTAAEDNRKQSVEDKKPKSKQTTKQVDHKHHNNTESDQKQRASIVIDAKKLKEGNAHATRSKDKPKTKLENVHVDNSTRSQGSNKSLETKIPSVTRITTKHSTKSNSKSTTQTTTITPHSDKMSSQTVTSTQITESTTAAVSDLTNISTTAISSNSSDLAVLSTINASTLEPSVPQQNVYIVETANIGNESIISIELNQSMIIDERLSEKINSSETEMKREQKVEEAISANGNDMANKEDTKRALIDFNKFESFIEEIRTSLHKLLHIDSVKEQPIAQTAAANNTVVRDEKLKLVNESNESHQINDTEKIADVKSNSTESIVSLASQQPNIAPSNQTDSNVASSSTLSGPSLIDEILRRRHDKLPAMNITDLEFVLPNTEETYQVDSNEADQYRHRQKEEYEPRYTNDHGWPVHSYIADEEFGILKVTDRFGNLITNNGISDDQAESSEEEDDFFDDSPQFADSIPYQLQVMSETVEELSNETLVHYVTFNETLEMMASRNETDRSSAQTLSTVNSTDVGKGIKEDKRLATENGKREAKGKGKTHKKGKSSKKSENKDKHKNSTKVHHTVKTNDTHNGLRAHNVTSSKAQ